MSYRRKRTGLDVFEELRGEISRMFEELAESMFPEKPMHNASRRELQPLTNIYETDGEVVVTFDLPCVRKEDIKLRVTETMLKVEASMKECVRFTPWGPQQRETEFDVFKKTVRLPVAVDPRKAKAKFKEGILEVALPKKPVGFEVPVE